MIKKIPTSQDCYYKWAPKNSGETSINLSKDIVSYILPTAVSGNDYPITFSLYKDDYLKAIGYLMNIMPLYTSTSKSSSQINYDPNYFKNLYSQVESFFRKNNSTRYSVNLKYREDGRIYLNQLDYNGFNIRNFLVEFFSVIIFDRTNDGIVLRIVVGPIGSSAKELTSEERKEAFFQYVELKKNGKIVSNYKDAISNPKRGTTIYQNMIQLDMPGMLYDYTDVSRIHILYQKVVSDPDNAVWNQTCSATVACYRDFLLSFYENPQAIKTDRIIDASFKPLCGSLQQIFYGAPGTGKSHSVDIVTKGQKVIRTTFHPDSDYATFVGAYKPTMEKVTVRDDRGFPVLENGEEVTEKKIVYQFIPQAFIQAYVEAWKDLKRPVYLVIEEINRGNCAQIFGDIFQLLDRNENGYSSYMISPDEDICNYLEDTFANVGFDEDADLDKSEILQIWEGKKMCLPPNLHIWATMNTSDQSLFPIDSAFKRRWDWKYTPISDAGKGYRIDVNGNSYDWWSFLEKVNEIVEEMTSSEDKQLGYFFCKAENGVISAEKFVGKVIFYLWNDVFKDYGFDRDEFKYEENGKIKPLTFRKFFMADGKINEGMAEKFLTNLGLTAIAVSEQTISQEEEEALEEDGGKKEGKHDFIKAVTLDGFRISTDDMTHFDVYMETLRRIGIAQVAPLIESCKFKRKKCPLASTVRYDAIENAPNYSYVQEEGYYFVKGAADETLINVLNMLKTELSLDLEIEIYR